MADYDKYDLRYNRHEVVIELQSADDDDEIDEAIIINQIEQNLILDRKSRLVKKELNERRWPQMYLQYLVNRVNQADVVRIRFSDLPDIASLSVHGTESSSSSMSLSQRPKYEESIEQHIEVLELRRRDAQTGKEISWATVNTLIHGLTSGIQGYPDDVDIAFRLFDSDSHARFFAGRHDIRCSNWEEFDIWQPLHKKGAKRHIKFAPIPTNYISISTSPRRIWNLVVKNPARDDQKIAVIDLRILRRLGIAYGSTIDDLGFRHHNKSKGTGTRFATKHHVLVLGWLPPHCICGLLSREQFRALLKQSRIDNSNSEDILSSEYDKKISFESILQCLH